MPVFLSTESATELPNPLALLLVHGHDPRP